MKAFWIYCLALYLCCANQVFAYSAIAENTKPLVRSKRSYTCTDYPSVHTMCLTDRGTDIPLADAEKQAIVEQHNLLRTGVSPPAEDMQKMYWDDELAVIAGKWAAQCVEAHDPNENRRAKHLPGVRVGQNLGFGYDDFTTSVKAWYDEVDVFEYGTGALTSDPIGHYTQVVLATAARVGCAMSNCTGKMDTYNVAYACNYATGQLSSQKKQPYCTGSSCATCSTKTDEMCDCQGKVCFNGGTFDVKTCSCRCYPLYTGDQCETRACPAENQDYSKCRQPDKADWCSRFDNWAPESCPFFCGLCPETCSITCENGGSVNSVPCTCLCPPGFSGDRCEKTDPTPSADVCGGMTCPPGTALYEPNCHCAEDIYDCEGTAGDKQHPSCPMAWCENSFWRLLCPHVCGKCGGDCTKRRSNQAWFCHFASCDEPHLKDMCPFACKTC